MMQGEREKGQAAEAQQENTRILSQGRVTAAQARTAGLLSVQELKNTLRTQEGARRAMVELQVAGMRTNDARYNAYARQLGSYLGSGQQPPDALLEAISAGLRQTNPAGSTAAGWIRNTRTLPRPLVFLKCPKIVLPINGDALW